MNLPTSVSLVEVGPRDGLQNESIVLNSKTRVEFIRQLADCGLRRIEAGAFVHPEWVPQMADSDQVLENLPQGDNISYPVLVPNRHGLEAAVAAGATEIAIFAAASETFTRKNINCSIAQSIERFREVAEADIARGLKIRGYISCVMGCPYEGIIDPEMVVSVSKALLDLGCYEISLGDTIGTGTPLQVQRLIDRLLNIIPIDQLAVHFHDTYGQALANIFAALQMGVATVDSSVAGLGGCPYAKGASGNVSTEDVVYMLDGLGIEHGTDLEKLIETGRNICEILGRTPMSKTNLAST